MATNRATAERPADRHRLGPLVQRWEEETAAAFLAGYGVFRFVAEWFREPDSFLGLLSLGLSMGQWLCLPMIAAGAGLWWWAGWRDGVGGQRPQ